jgi:hypothetical protein
MDKKIAVASSLWGLEVGLSEQTRVNSQTRCQAWEYRIQRTAKGPFPLAFFARVLRPRWRRRPTAPFDFLARSRA